MFESLEWQMVLRLIVAAILGGIVGLEREGEEKPAGLRTHVLVCCGSALLMLISNYAFDPNVTPRDPGRIAAQVVSGIGFLGAGTILHEGITIRGLTTAASLWMIAAIGLACGAGMFLVAFLSTAITMIALVTFQNWEKRISNSNNQERRFLRIVMRDEENSLSNLMQFLADRQAKVKNLDVKNDRFNKQLVVELNLKVAKESSTNLLVADMNELPGIISIEKAK